MGLLINPPPSLLFYYL